MNDENFKEYHDEDLTFYKESMVSFSQCTPNRNMSWTDILKFTSDFAGEDFTKRGMSWPVLMEKGIAFIVSRSSFHIYKMPAADQRITLKTFEAAPQGPLSTRFYILYDTQTNEMLIKAQTLWAIMDMKQRKMIPAKAYTLRPTPTLIEEFEGLPAAKIKAPENMEVFGSHKIVFSDLDANGHTNNAKYANFIWDVLPEEFQNKVFKDFKLNYSKEAMLNEEVVLKGAIDSDAKKITIIGYIEDQSSFEAELYW